MRPFFPLILLGCLLVISLGGWASDTAATQSQLATLKKSISHLQSQLKNDLKKQTKAASALADVEKQIGELGKQVHQIDQKILTLKVDLTGFEAEKKRLENQLAAKKERLIELVRQQYRLGQQPRLLLLLNQRDPEQLSRMLKYYDRFSSAQAAELREFQQLLTNLKNTHLSIGTTKQAMLDQKTQLDKQLSDLQEVRQSRESTLATLNKQIKEDKNRLSQLQANRTRLEKVLKEVEKSVSLANLTQNNQKFRTLKGKLNAPAKGKTRRRFGHVQDNIRYDGLLISGKTGDRIEAVHHGRVVFSDWLRGYGLLTIVDHGDGYMTLYGHNDALLKETGDWVAQGEQIATLGNSGGYAEPGLYFAIRYKGKAINPASWLSNR